MLWIFNVKPKGGAEWILSDFPSLLALRPERYNLQGIGSTTGELTAESILARGVSGRLRALSISCRAGEWGQPLFFQK